MRVEVDGYPDAVALGRLRGAKNITGVAHTLRLARAARCTRRSQKHRRQMTQQERKCMGLRVDCQPRHRPPPLRPRTDLRDATDPTKLEPVSIGHQGYVDEALRYCS